MDFTKFWNANYITQIWNKTLSAEMEYFKTVFFFFSYNN